MRKTKFVMAFHCYQPVFNFDNEIERAYDRAYLPLLTTLEEFPDIKVSFHYSGNLLEWLEHRHSEYVESIKKLVRYGRIELISGGYFDPIMPIIPERDRKQQLRMNEEIIKRIFAVEPRGAWIGERVWEPSLTDTLIKAGLKYTIVDDYHLMQAGIKRKDIFKPYFVEAEHGSITLFPSLTKFRYLMPFSMPEVTLDYIRSNADRNDGKDMCFFFADDGEKFGAWPYTYQWVHEKGWLRRFFQLLQENNTWLQTATYSEVVNTVSPEKVDELPASSYAEMMKWSGGNFKNFLKKYPEAERMHKRMLIVSDMIEAADSQIVPNTLSNQIKEAQKELYKAQSNCAYWHGVFGGLYLPHLRSGVYTHLIKAQKIIDKLKSDKTSDEHTSAVKCKIDSLSHETVISNKLISIFVKTSNGGCINELDYKPLNLNLVNTVSRIKEAYHKKLEKSYFTRIRQARKAIAEGNLADIHDALGIQRRGLRKALVYDDYRRVSFLTHIFTDRKSWKKAYRTSRMPLSCNSFLKGRYMSRLQSDEGFISYVLFRRDKVFVDGGTPIDLEINKEITVGTGPALMFLHKIFKHSSEPVIFEYGIEFNFLIWDKEVISKPRFTETDRFSLRDQYSDIILDFFLDKKFFILRYPIYSINETEAGLSKTFQGVSVLIGDEYNSKKRSARGDTKITIAIR